MLLNVLNFQTLLPVTLTTDLFSTPHCLTYVWYFRIQYELHNVPVAWIECEQEDFSDER